MLASPSASRAHAQRPLALHTLKARAIRARRQRIEAHLLTARRDRRHHVLPAVAQQQQVHERRRLLQRLQHAVGRLFVHRVHRPRSRTPAAPTRTACASPPPPPAPRCPPPASPPRPTASPTSGPGARRAPPAPPPSPACARPSASSAAANARAIARLPVPAGPWNRYACEGATLRRQRRAQHRPRMRVRIDPRQMNINVYICPIGHVGW